VSRRLSSRGRGLLVEFVPGRGPASWARSTTRRCDLHGTQFNFFVALTLLKSCHDYALGQEPALGHDRSSLGNDGINQEVAVQGFPDEFAFSISGHS
jgi:hypothetical protein